MNFKKILLAACAVQGILGTAQAQNQPPRPKLVVGIVLDQMRWDYLYRYADRFGKGGFKRLLKDGFSCQNTSINYLPSFTAPGHSCIYTGSVPALHGIAANEWIDKLTRKEVYCTEDKDVRSVGNNGDAGKMSPKNLLASTITDELRLATNFKAKTIGVSLKDRGSILPAGHTASGAYWFDGKDGQFITSTFYTNTLPKWVLDFNARNCTDSLLKNDWNTLYPIESYTQSTADDNAYEGKLKGEKAPVFPHQLAQNITKDKGVIRSTPWGNTLTRLMGEAAIAGEGLGKDEVTDFLAISFSSTDYIGHVFAPNSIEVEDCYLRMDKELELFLNYLDKQVGKGKYTVFLTADHGGAHNVTFLQDHKLPGANFDFKKVSTLLNDRLQRTFKADSLVHFDNYQIYFNEAAIAKNNLDLKAISAETKRIIEQVDFVSYVFDMKDQTTNIAPEHIWEMAVNGYNRKRSGDLQVILDPGHYSGYGSTGTTHGSWNPYDAHIPLIFYGWGIQKGASFKPYYMTDIAPTIAALLHIQAPNANIGTPIVEVLK
ncbi:alkaline phosphatase family protein [Taibaiella sp. KBW10]|uniref:alkaline phosphatase PafA n=1 Tax=Taibaiella sp. KBW10 TaxID=2153357 RepID=UPI000F5B3AE0|nr:alkaline phosphatase PafA [Taibaiella sp. KBW10]RQO31622.1 alkaline phosphatase family protein [Taibaiella sp. KBW10]